VGLLSARDVRWQDPGRRRDFRPAADGCGDCRVDLSDFIPIHAGIACDPCEG